MRYLFITCIAVLFYVSAVFADEYPKIGVVANQYDHVEKILQKYKVPYKMIPYGDIEKESIYTDFDVLFFPCGSEMPLNSSMNILAHGSQISSVTLNDQYYKVDIKKVGQYISAFIARGGSAYFSDFSFRYLHEGSGIFSFYKDFPYIGYPGSFKAIPTGEFEPFSSKEAITLGVAHSGWVVPSEVKKSDVFLFADCATGLGQKRAPIGFVYRVNEGAAVYTSYHDSNDTDRVMRFVLMRTILNKYSVAAAHYVKKWEQKSLSIVVDSVLSGESYHSYTVKLVKGRNYLYFGGKGSWRIDILRSNGLPEYSNSSIFDGFIYPMKRDSQDEIRVRVFPVGVNANRIFSLTTAHGLRVFPYYMHILLGAGAVFLLFIYIRYLSRQRYRGKVHSSDITNGCE